MSHEAAVVDLDHVSLSVTDYERSKAFYQKALAPLGIKLVMEGASGAGFGRSWPRFWIRQGVGAFQTAEQLRAITPVHVSFAAGSRDEVVRFHEAE